MSSLGAFAVPGADAPADPPPEPAAAARWSSADLDAFIGEISRDRFVHMTAASRVDPFDRLAAPLLGGARGLLLSDLAENVAECASRADALRRIAPGRPVATTVVDPVDYWDARRAPRAELVFDMGNLLTDPAPDRRLLRLADMASRQVCISSMILPPIPDIERTRTGRAVFFSAQEVAQDARLRDLLRSAYADRGLLLPQLAAEGGHFDEWCWFFTPDSLIAMGRSVGLAVARCHYTWFDIAVTILFDKVEP